MNQGLPKGRALAATIRPDIQAMSSYPVPDATGLIKLDAMENPYPLPPELADALGRRLAEVALNRYPSPRPVALLDKLRRAMKVPDACALLLGNGSDELISIMSLATARPGAKVLAPVPGFVMYKMAAQFANQTFVGVPLRADLSLDTEAMLAAIERERPALIYLAYPNNPTGGLFDDAAMETLIAAAPDSLVVIDEAYQPFAEKTWIDRVPRYENVAVLRTVSKLGLAGIRLGFLAAAPAWIAEFDKVRPPYNVNVLTQAAADFLLDHVALFDSQAETLRAERARLAEAVAALPGTTVFPSAGNFLLVRVPDAKQVFDALLGAGVLIKNVSAMHPLLDSCVRLTVGSPDENQRLVAALRDALAE
ncbi:histidinol-phosphate transaminase [Chitinasiproducens palmae]|uniref:Histidinol-phosphate aminotransferase n=1 Tax=Chitinasiproducens palmae TaxID=1770053 RepID=A0A1H2PWF2_9BURK|nr:histidinol-phosphate transaminase [Chitinasiproducens palmae]SDV51280.1 histidinol phosphate aminotransferase apoenzyme [Chitinasiproducens palmae]